VFVCGIAGALYADPARTAEPEVLQATGAAIARRTLTVRGFGGGRASGWSTAAWRSLTWPAGQPLGNEDGPVQVVFNGEIHDNRELSVWLQAWGRSFRTRSDTEVLVHLYEGEGDRLVERLRGMFAFALWDGNRRLVLARDRVGIKPLCVDSDGDMLLFGPELKAILAHPAALEGYLAFGMVPGPGRSFARARSYLPAASGR
jgi:asparagine synthase (glutamine-hydrolysing)